MNYHIGRAGIPWSDAEKTDWLNQQIRQRSYMDQVVSVIESLRVSFEVVEYGRLRVDPELYPLFLIKSANWNHKLPVVLITGGVHGYEASGVNGALDFLCRMATHYSAYFNFVVAPCISPWAYETINRWNSAAVDPNRSFYSDSPCEEVRLFTSHLKKCNFKFFAHFDLHETTDTDETEFRPALAARDGIEYQPGTIPKGFYLVANELQPQFPFQSSIIDAVKSLAVIAPADERGNIIGQPIDTEGVISFPMVDLGLCGGFTSASYHTTTEVYPNLDGVTQEQCTDIQVAAICAGLDYLLKL